LIEKGYYYCKQNPKHTHRMLKDGVPEEIRGKFWMTLCNSEFLRSQNEGVYEKLKNSESPPAAVLEQIQTDLERTFPELPFFCTEQGLKSLENVLKAFSLYNNQVEYVQGCNFLTGVLLTLLDEETSFWVLVELMNNYSFQGMFADGFPHLKKCLFIYEKLFQKLEPELWEHFQQEGVETTSYTIKWFMTLFACALPLPAVLIIWDWFLLKGWRFVIKICFGILRFFKEQLMNADFITILNLLKSVESMSEKDPNFLVRLAFEVKVPDPLYQKIKREYELTFNVFLK